MIDFPNSPTDGQVFVATNGVIYKWSAGQSAWLTQAGPPSSGGTGQVTVTGGGYTAAVGVDVVIPFGTVLYGNSGLWWNTTTNRYTPPAGSYFLSCIEATQAPSGGNGTWTLKPRKNGVAIPGVGASASGGALFSIPITCGVYVDANGTDYFDWVANQATAGMNAQGGTFSAFPLTGMTGPNGLPGGGPPNSDFSASASGNVPLSTAYAVVVANAVNTGNFGGYYNIVTGRFMPPAGRYLIFGLMVGALSSTAIQIFLQLRKNGVALQTSISTPAASNYSETCKVQMILDANGTDYFELWASGNAAGGVASTLAFGATPTQGLPGASGVQGPAGGTFPAGTVVDFAGAVAPAGWYLCDGSTRSRTGDATLFNAIGTTWGNGDGSTTFNLPDLRGRVTAGLDPGGTAGRLTTAISGVAGQTLGATGGDQRIHNHSHGVNVGGISAPGVNVRSMSGDGTQPGTFNTSGVNDNVGNSQNMPPVAVMNKIIKN